MTGEQLLTIIIVTPGATFLVLALVWMLGWTPPERFIAKLTAVVSLAITGAAAALSVGMIRSGRPVQVSLGDWFHLRDYHFPLTLLADWLSLPMIVLTSILVGIVGAFSRLYLHRERGFFRFFVLLHLFAFSSMLTLAAGSLDLLICGWELVGLTSVLLVAFFDDRREPVRNALRVFGTYRLADLGLLLGVVLIHSTAGTTEVAKLFIGDWPAQSAILGPGSETLLALLLVWGAAGKSAQLPFSGWLPRAMEGPTPSSAAFYGAIAVHLGAYLLLRNFALLALSPIARTAVITTGVLTALLGVLSHRVISDAKTSLAYAVMTQLGVIFVEIGLGFPRLALFHMLGHMVVRTLQFLRSPSALHDYRMIHAASGGDIGKTGAYYEGRVPMGLRTWLYRAGLERGFYDAAVDRLIVRPAFALSRGLAWFESHKPTAEEPKL